MSECVCGGQHMWTWHKNRGIPQCDHSRATKREQTYNWNERQTGRRTVPPKRPWRHGTSIYLDENEAL